MFIIDWIKNLFKSEWLKNLLASILNNLKNILEQVGKENINLIKMKIVEVNAMDIPGTEKLKLVAEYVRCLMPQLSNKIINRIIENLLGELENKGVI